MLTPFLHLTGEIHRMYFFKKNRPDLITNKSNILTAVVATQTKATQAQNIYGCSNPGGVFNLKCPQVHPINMNMGGKR